MPRLIACETDDRIELGDLVEMLEAGPFDPEDEDNIAAWGPALRKLSNNRRFLGDLVIAELKQRCAGQLALNQYSAQVIVLHAGSRKFLLRANFWPAARDSVVINSGTAPFFYDVPHDHNFTFLTVGYLGPGYWSDYFEYDYGDVVGYPGEQVDLRFVERSRLAEGRVLLYRKHRDVHRQLPPDEMSVSLNILAVSPTSELRDQYRFDVERSQIAGLVNPSSLETLVLLAARFGGGNGRDLVETFARHHPSDRIRFAAVRARAAAAPDLGARISIYERAARSTGFVGAMAEREARRISETRGWLVGGGAR
jgi:hypothetical protein